MTIYMNLAEEIRQTRVAPGELAICWLGQAGFLLKDSRGRTVAIDPYLSNCGERLRGFKRLSPMLLTPEDFQPDYLVATHLHFDHFDYDAIPVIADNSPHTRFLGPASCMEQLRELEVAEERLSRLDRGECFRDEGLELRATVADHGEMAPDAIGLLVEMEGHRLYFSGDTAFHEELLRETALYHPEVAMLSVNGKFGNLSAQEGAKAAELLGVSYAVPCHCWTFVEHEGNPGEFCRLLLQGNRCHPLCFRQGEFCVLDGEKKFCRRKETA